MRSNSQGHAEVDVDVAQSATPKQIAAVVNKAREQKKLENKISRLEEELKKAKKDLQIINGKELPELMLDANLDECPLGSGWSIKIDNITTASIPAPDSKAENAEERHEAGIKAARKYVPDLVKNTITIFFGLEDEKFFQKVMRDIKQRKKELDYSVKSAVHGQSLSAWVREQDRLGKSVDEVAFNVHRIKVSKLIAPKKARNAVGG